MDIKMLLIALLFGIGFGYFVQGAGICFANGLGEVFSGKGKRIAKVVLVIFVISNLGFLLSGYINGDLGLKAIGEIRGYGFYNLLAGMIFGIGIFTCGGCIIGSLRQLGEGNLGFLITIISFIPGMALVVFVINPLLEDSYHVVKETIPSLMGIDPVWPSLVLSVFALIGLWKLLKKT